jgi:hypothetical protein
MTADPTIIKADGKKVKPKRDLSKECAQGRHDACTRKTCTCPHHGT